MSEVKKPLKNMVKKGENACKHNVFYPTKDRSANFTNTNLSSRNVFSLDQTDILFRKEEKDILCVNYVMVFTDGELLDQPTACDEPSYMYYVNDGVYGSFNCLLYDHATVKVSTTKVN